MLSVICIQIGGNLYNHFMIKLGKREHMANLVEKGQLRFGTLKEYRGSELNQVGDPSEGSYSIKHIQNAKFKKFDKESGEYVDIGIMSNGVLRHFYEHILDTRIYSIFYFVVENKDGIQIKDFIDLSLVAEFGYNSAVLITDVHKFTDLINQRLTEHKLFFSGKNVNYIDMSTDLDNLTPFDKDKFYSRQNEFRFVIDNLDAPEFLELGNISKIALLLDVQDLGEISIHTQRR
jgi:uncharacterized protein YunC (DUF1805 family)